MTQTDLRVCDPLMGSSSGERLCITIILDVDNEMSFSFYPGIISNCYLPHRDFRPEMSDKFEHARPFCHGFVEQSIDMILFSCAPRVDSGMVVCLINLRNLNNEASLFTCEHRLSSNNNFNFLL